ncbi:hypothetical protein VPH35_128258 [Triticum aestivum]
MARVSGWASPSSPARLRWTPVAPLRLLFRHHARLRFPPAMGCSLTGAHRAGHPLFLSAWGGLRRTCGTRTPGQNRRGRRWLG